MNRFIRYAALSLSTGLCCWLTFAGEPTNGFDPLQQDRSIAAWFAAGDKQALSKNLTQLQQQMNQGQQQANSDRRYFLMLSYYRLGLLDHQHGKSHFEQCLAESQQLIAQSPAYVEAYILSAACANSLIGYDRERTMELSLAGRTALQEAGRLAPSNPRLSYLQGVTAIYTPPQFGGGLAKASELLKHAIKTFEATQKTAQAWPSWGHDEAYLWSGVIYSADKKQPEAIAALEHSLRIADSSWVKSMLLPSLKSGKSIAPYFGLHPTE